MFHYICYRQQKIWDFQDAMFHAYVNRHLSRQLKFGLEWFVWLNCCPFLTFQVIRPVKPTNSFGMLSLKGIPISSGHVLDQLLSKPLPMPRATTAKHCPAQRHLVLRGKLCAPRGFRTRPLLLVSLAFLSHLTPLKRSMNSSCAGCVSKDTWLLGSWPSPPWPQLSASWLLF